MTTAFTDEIVEVGGAKIQVLKGGSGDPLVLFHGAEGNSGWLKYVQALSDHYTVYIPTHPGYAGSYSPDWLGSIPDLAAFYTWFLEQQGLEGARAIGFSMGGWLASEIAASCRHAFSKLMLVGAAGVRPQQGEIADIFILSPAQVSELLFHDPSQGGEFTELYGGELSPEQTDAIEQNREMAVRLCWKPYMFDARLPGLLGRVNIPTNIVWGREDALVPLECGELYHKAIPGSNLVVLDNCGHVPQIEKTDEFVKTALEFLA